ncbi:MAG: hypothetical protein IRZ20_05560 [Thermoleophilia bacterium]|nr:hypothetical protein [Thermoleophilia bacterium]
MSRRYALLLLDEALTFQKLAGLVLITGGVALGAGAVRLAQPVNRRTSRRRPRLRFDSGAAARHC